MIYLLYYWLLLLILPIFFTQQPVCISKNIKMFFLYYLIKNLKNRTMMLITCTRFCVTNLDLVNKVVNYYYFVSLTENKLLRNSLFFYCYYFKEKYSDRL